MVKEIRQGPRFLFGFTFSPLAVHEEHAQAYRH